VLVKLAICGLLVCLFATIGCSDGRTREHLVRGGDVVRAFKAHGIVLQNSHLFGEKDAITSGYFFATPEASKVTLFVAVCRSDEVARDLARQTGSPLARKALVERRKNVVVYLAADTDAGSRRGALEALKSL
jgi:hypothetical protein